MNYLKVLGSSGNKTKKSGTTSFQISKDSLIDAGNIIRVLDDKSHEINNIFLTHAHLDHINDIPFVLDNCYTKREQSLKIYASFETIKFLKEHIFNDKIWPDFSKIKLLNRNEYSLEFIEIDDKKEIFLNDFSIKAIKTNHMEGSFGYIVTKNQSSYIVSGDTDFNENLIRVINSTKNLKALFIECSFPNSLEVLANSSKHLTPNSLKEIIDKIERKDIQIYLYHLKNVQQDILREEIEELGILKSGGKILEDGDSVLIDDLKVFSKVSDSEILDRVMEINLKLSAEKDREVLYEMILTLIRELTQSDAGTLYLLSEDKRHLEFKVVQNSSLNTFLGTKEQKIFWDPLPLYLQNGEENRNMVAVCCALDKKIINIKDIYNNSEYNFEGAKAFDKKNGYCSKSMLVVPLVNHENDTIGVIQLLNKEIHQKNSSYTKYDEKISKALSLQASMSLTNAILINSLEEFLESFVNSIADAIDAKSRHTSTHIKKMSKLVPMIAKSINADDGIYKNVKYTKNDFKEIELAAKLHDIGKISIPEWVIDKSTKLQKLIDGFELVILRFELIKRDLKIDYLENRLTKDDYKSKLNYIEDSLEFLKTANIGGEFMSDEAIKRVEDIASYKYIENGKEKNLLTSEEVYNLSIRKGTLTKEEKDIMNSHADLSYKMLSNLNFPKKYSNVMHIAVNHHEKLNGKGYPRGLKDDDIVLEDRILILADVFEALTSSDRPYKGIKKLSEVFRILDFMVKDGEIDSDLLEFFKNSNAFKAYCKDELLDEQIDV